MWNTVDRVHTGRGVGALRAALVPAEPGRPPLQLDPIAGLSPVALQLPDASPALTRIHVNVREAMRIVTGVAEPKAAAALLRQQATAAAQQPRPDRSRVSGRALDRPIDLRALYEQTQADLQRCKDDLQHATVSGTKTQVAACRQRLAEARNAARIAKLALDQVQAAIKQVGRKSPERSRPPKKSGRRAKAKKGDRQKPPAKETRLAPAFELDAGIHFTADPDTDTKMVWVLRTGRSFHRRDCHLIEGREGAARIPVSTAHQRGLERCMHCVPSVR